MHSVSRVDYQARNKLKLNLIINIVITIGFSDMRVSQIDELRKIGYALSDDFKTSGTYGLQPIMLSSFSYRVVFIYIDHIRKLIAPDDRVNWDDDDFLWLDYDGQRQMGIGSFITNYFRKKLR